MARLATALLACAGVAALAVSVREVGPLVDSAAPAEFYDLQVFANELRSYERTGELYAIDRPDFFAPGSIAYQYPPPFAAILSAAIDPGRPAQQSGPRLVWGSLVCLAIGAAALARSALPGHRRMLVLATVALAWPHWESLTGPQMEPLLFALLAVGAFLVHRGRATLAGVCVGLAASLKVYPVGVAWAFAHRRAWRAFPGVVVGISLGVSLAGLSLPARFSWQYATEILPRLGGVALSLENVSLGAHLSRSVLALTRRLPADDQLTLESVRFLPSVVRSTFSPLVTVLFLLACVVVVGLSILLWRRGRATPERDLLLFGLAITSVVWLLPTSWMNYQGLLLAPALIVLGRARLDERLAWVCALAVLAVVRISSGGNAWEEQAWTISTLRGTAPLLLSIALWRLLALRGEGT